MTFDEKLNRCLEAFEDPFGIHHDLEAMWAEAVRMQDRQLMKRYLAKLHGQDEITISDIEVDQALVRAQSQQGQERLRHINSNQ
jgi:hypothetical protein